MNRSSLLGLKIPGVLFSTDSVPNVQASGRTQNRGRDGVGVMEEAGVQSINLHIRLLVLNLLIQTDVCFVQEGNVKQYSSSNGLLTILQNILELKTDESGKS